MNYKSGYEKHVFMKRAKYDTYYIETKCVYIDTSINNDIPPNGEVYTLLMVFSSRAYLILKWKIITN